MKIIKKLIKWWEDYKFNSLTSEEKLAIGILQFLNNNYLKILNEGSYINIGKGANLKYFRFKFDGVIYSSSLNFLGFSLETYNPSLFPEQGINYKFNFGLSLIKRDMFEYEFNKFYKRLKVENEELVL